MSAFSLIPLNNYKIPVIPKWKPFQTEIAPEEPAKEHVKKGGNLGLVTGHLKYFLEVIDVDCKYDVTGDLWTNLKAAIPQDLFSQLAIQETVNGGYHLFYIRESLPDGNQKLAQRYSTEEELAKDPQDKIKALIETRGAGGYVCIYPSKGYKWIQKSIKNIPTITDKQADYLLSICRQFNQVFKEAYTPNQKVFEDYKQKGPPALNQLLAAGWETVKEDAEYIQLRRPGKDIGQSGSINKTTGNFLCFTTSSDFDAFKTYDNVAVFTQLNANGNYQEARKLLERDGYGEPVIKQDNYKNNGQDKQAFNQGIDLEEQFKKDLERFKKDNDELRNNVVSGPIEMTPLVMHMDGNTAVFDGNLCGIQGSYGTGKSRMAQAICTLVLANDKDLVHSGLKINPMLTQRPVVIMIDTERSKNDRLPKAVQNVIKNAGYDPEEKVEDFEYFTIRGVSRLSRRRMVQHVLGEMAEKYKHRKMFLSLDIVTDMVKTFMDEIDSMALTDSLNNMFDDYDCSGVVVIHTNRGGEESLGHLGAELDRKVTTKIHLHQDPKTGFLEVSMGKNNEGERPTKYVMSFDTKTDLYQFDASASLSIGVDIGVKNNVHKYIKIDETVKEQELAERLAEEEDISLSAETIKRHLKRMADQMTPVCDPFGEPIGYFLRKKEKDGKTRSAYTTLIKHEKATK